MGEDAKKIIIVAGEASGDLHGAKLVGALKSKRNNLKISGFGGRLMEKAGVEIYNDLTPLATVGFVEVFKNLRVFRKAFNQILEKIDTERPELVILIDYPGFNLRLARELKKKSIPVIYYISPQVWAWGRRRIKQVKELVDKMIVVFDFEARLYREAGVNVEFVGHPLLDTVKSGLERKDVFKQLGIPPQNRVITLLPGSREAEVRRMLPLMLKVAKIIAKNLKDVSFVLPESGNVPKYIFKNILGANKLSVYPAFDFVYEALSVSDLALVASGTATLEAAIIFTPMLIVYKVSFLTWLLLKSLIKIPYIGLVNIVAGEKIVPEFLQYNTRPKDIARDAIDLLDSKERQEEIRASLRKVKNSLGGPGASERAAEIILGYIP